MATVSRTAIFALGVTLLVYFAYTLFWGKRRILKAYILVIGLLIFSLFIPLIKTNSIYDEIIHRLNNVDDGADFRVLIWKNRLSTFDLSDWLFGKGKGFAQTFSGGFTLGADSQYVRLILESGLFGLSLWLSIIFIILNFALRNHKHAPSECLFIILIIIGYLVMGVTHELFLVAIQGSLFWIMLGLFIGTIYQKKNTAMGNMLTESNT